MPTAIPAYVALPSHKKLSAEEWISFMAEGKRPPQHFILTHCLTACNATPLQGIHFEEAERDHAFKYLYRSFLPVATHLWREIESEIKSRHARLDFIEEGARDQVYQFARQQHREGHIIPAVNLAASWAGQIVYNGTRDDREAVAKEMRTLFERIQKRSSSFAQRVGNRAERSNTATRLQ